MISLKIEGMVSERCASALKRAILFRDPDAIVTVNVFKGVVCIESDKDESTFLPAIQSAGYDTAEPAYFDE